MSSANAWVALVSIGVAAIAEMLRRRRSREMASHADDVREWSRDQSARLRREVAPKPTFVADPIARFACARCGELTDADALVTHDALGRICVPCDETLLPNAGSSYRG